MDSWYNCLIFVVQWESSTEVTIFKIIIVYMYGWKIFRAYNSRISKYSWQRSFSNCKKFWKEMLQLLLTVLLEFIDLLVENKPFKNH